MGSTLSLRRLVGPPAPKQVWMVDTPAQLTAGTAQDSQVTSAANLASMGKFSLNEFGRSKLPSRAIFCAGVYLPGRKDVVRRSFQSWERIRGTWIRYSFARHAGKEYVVLFGVYGAAMALEALQLLRDGEVRSAFFVGSMYAKKLPVGAIFIPTEIEDRAGIVPIDDPRASYATPDKTILALTRAELKKRKVTYSEGRISSVPAVLHGIEHVHDSVRLDRSIMGQEMEGSTFLHFTKKHGIRSGALLYVSDNERHSIISGAKGVREARRRALKNIARVAVEVLQSL